MKFLESFLPKLFITLMPSSKGTLLYGELRKNGKLIKRYEEQLIEGNSALQKRIKTLEKESAMSYVALLETEADQGLLRDCRSSEAFDLSSVEKICVDNRWGIYISKDDLFERQKRYNNRGLDFVFSPYSLLYDFFIERLQQSDGLYLLLTEDFMISAVFKDTAMIFAQKVSMQEELSLVDETKVMQKYIENIQTIVKAFYDAKVDETMFIEKIYIADGVNFDTGLENQLEETLFVEVQKQSIELSHALILLSEKELG